MVRAVLLTPPSPSTTSLYKVILPAILAVAVSRCGDGSEVAVRGLRGS